jgi:hypothetical protein
MAQIEGVPMLVTFDLTVKQSSPAEIGGSVGADGTEDDQLAGDASDDCLVITNFDRVQRSGHDIAGCDVCHVETIFVLFPLLTE